jgi:hypothetical protein
MLIVGKMAGKETCKGIIRYNRVVNKYQMLYEWLVMVTNGKSYTGDN